MEDAEALGAILKTLPSSPTSSEVTAALTRVFNARIKRATRVQQVSRFAGLGEMRKQGIEADVKGGQGEDYFNMMKFRSFNWDYHGVERWEKEHPEWVIQSEA